jgi:hypothetical protein
VHPFSGSWLKSKYVIFKAPALFDSEQLDLHSYLLNGTHTATKICLTSELSHRGWFGCVSRGADKMPGHEAHSSHIVLTRVPAFITGAGGLAINCPWEGITVFPVDAFRQGA